MFLKKYLIFLLFLVFSCSKDNKEFIVFNKDNTNKISENDEIKDKALDNKEDSFESLIDLKGGYKALIMQQENLNLDAYFEQVVLAQNFSDAKAYLFIIGFDPKNQSGIVLFSTEVDIDTGNSYGMYLEDITGNYDFNIIVQGFSEDKSVLYVFEKSNPNDVTTYTPIFFDKINGTILINKYERSSDYEDKKSRESYSISLDKYEKKDEDTIINKTEKYGYLQSQRRYFLDFSKEVVQKINRLENDIYRTLKNLNKEEVYGFLDGVWYDNEEYKQFGDSDFNKISFLSFSKQGNEIQLFKNNSQEVAKIEYISKPAYNTLYISTKSIFSDLIIYNFWIKILGNEDLEVKVDTGMTYYDNKPGFSGLFKKITKNIFDLKRENPLFIPNGNYLHKDEIYNFSFPNLTYIVGDNIYYGIFNVFYFNNSLILEYEIDMGDNKISQTFSFQYNEKVIKTQKLSSLLLSPVKILKDEVIIVKGQKLKLERIEKIG